MTTFNWIFEKFMFSIIISFKDKCNTKFTKVKNSQVNIDKIIILKIICLNDY